MNNMSEINILKKKNLQAKEEVDKKIIGFFSNDDPLLEGLLKSIQYSLIGQSSEIFQ